MAGQKKKKSWMRFRHRVVRNLGLCVIYPYTVLKYGIKAEPFKAQGNRQYLIAMNHQTAFDQFFIAMSVKGPVYYIASEDLFSIGWVSSLLRYLVAPIPIKKQTTDIQAVINCMKVAREGGTIALAPEGNRTFSGKTEYMKPSISKLVRKLKLPLAIYRIEGGYGVHPRWSDVVRKGRMRGYVSRVIEPEEYAALSDEELYALIQKELYVNEACVDGTFRHKKLAEYLERAMYVCPHCGLSEFYSHDDIIECKRCGCQIRYLPTKELEGINSAFPFRFVNDWYEYQCNYVNKIDPSDYLQTPYYHDTARLSEVILYKNKQLISEHAELSLYGDRITVNDDLVFSFDDISVITVLGKNKLNIYHQDHVYQIKSDKRFNALKYVNLFYRYKNIQSGQNESTFLGI